MQTETKSKFNRVQNKAAGSALKFESSYFSFKFVIGLQFSALVSRPSLARKSLVAKPRANFRYFLNIVREVNFYKINLENIN
jgi:hypothetical protein